MKRLLILLSACFLCVHFAAAQRSDILTSLRKNVPGQGKVTIHQDARIAALVGSDAVPAAADGSRVIKKAGYRIQVYAGNNTRAAKNEAHAVGVRVKELFPELPVYTSFNPPRWLCRAGDFSTIEEADAVMRRLRAVGDFKAVSIVREQINIPLE
ncbi:MAG TPA: SPOR domain-containing protein [Candidatus Bacteroides merdigallinarum]|uniref:SPOR domain-containing protein n=1 Tax=Candidatus Bacteroides merdigallinarum TaxID=2838473 RepID=A0A9D2J1J9_9BACE|nr:SPOR domain-containing protein [Candidatus Bacteroides merdigallinarum]